MSYLTFEIPQRLLQGLATGALERFGTIIKDVKTGQIVAHVREVFPAEELNKLQGQVTALGDTIMEMKDAQNLMAAGLGAVALISVVGFVYVGRKFASLEHKIEKQIEKLNVSVENIKQQVSLIRMENAIVFTKKYYSAVNAFMEHDFRDALRLARECSGDIESYLTNMPIDELLVDEGRLEFFIKFLLATMRCQLEAAVHLPDVSIPVIYQRYRNLFKIIEGKLGSKKMECRSALPSSQEDIKILNTFSQPSSFSNRLLAALPSCQNFLENERIFLELGSKDRIYQGKLYDDKEYIFVLENKYVEEMT